MRSIAILNQKGGVGKTTTAVHLAAGLALAGERVLLIDLDPQSHATLHLGVQVDDNEANLADVLLRRAAVAETMRTVTDGLSLLPATIDLVSAELDLREMDNREHVLAEALVPHADWLNYCLIDCPPSLGLLTVNALAAADEVIIPLQAHFLALQGLGRLLETILLVRRGLNPRLRVRGIVLCMFEKGTRLAQEVLDDVTRFLAAAEPADPWYGATVFANRIRRNVKLAECPSFGQTVYDYAPDSNGAEDYLALSQEVLDGSRKLSAETAPPVSVPAEDVLPADAPPPPADAFATPPSPPAEAVTADKDLST
ncbi:MAG: AAA family ATPase [Phycisphaerae bacterium]|jgi:chromosome partitioning protein